jgi:hypothetical protein
LKINRQDLREALLISVLEEFSDIPAENEIDYSFSPRFQARIKEISRKSEKAAWRFWHSSKRRLILVAVIVVLLAALAACAVPVIKQLYVDYFLVDNGESFGITFDPEQAATAPKKIETYWIPDYCPEGYSLISRIGTAAGVDCCWMNTLQEYVVYNQYVIPADYDNSTWITIDAEDVERSAEIINGYKVEVVESLSNHYLVAFWTDNLYLYAVEVSCFNSNKLDTVKSVMESLRVVDKVEPIG